MPIIIYFKHLYAHSISMQQVFRNALDMFRVGTFSNLFYLYLPSFFWLTLLSSLPFYIFLTIDTFPFHSLHSENNQSLLSAALLHTVLFGYSLSGCLFVSCFCRFFLLSLPFPLNSLLEYVFSTFSIFFYSGFSMISLLTNPYLCISKLSFDYIYKFHWILDLHTIQVQQTHYIQKLYSVYTFRTQGKLQLQEIQSTFWNGDTNSVPRASE